MKASHPVLERLALRTQIRSRLRSGRERRRSHATCTSIVRDLEAARAVGRPVDIVFDTLQGPPSFGDFLNVTMVARFLAGSGLDTRFVLVDGQERRWDWSDLSPVEQDEHVDACEELARVILAGLAPVERRCSASLSGHSFIAPLSGHPDAAYILSEGIFHVLMDEYGWPLPASFLLTVQDFAPVSPGETVPYVAWHVRRGRWDKSRDSTARDVLMDARSLREAFPDHVLMLFSSPEGIDFALGVLESHGDGVAKAVPQPAPGFLAAAPQVLGADFYYQRRGGGLSQFAVYSKTPYLVLNDHASYYYFRTGRRLVPWATPDQQYVIKPGVSRLDARDYLRECLTH